MNKAHCKQNLSNNHPLLRKQALEKSSLKKLDLPNWEWYINNILRLPPQNTLFICADETPITFRGSQHRRITAPRRITVYIRMKKPYFIYMQWAAACINIHIPQPHTIWKTENEKEVNKLKVKFNNKMQLLANLVNK